jgi:ubiquinone/menaquinone biosynthesis C-methylase UbiE
MRTLTPEEAKAFYDRFGKKQDSQAFYEARALNELLANGAFNEARSVFEFGCGTGRLALELLQHQLPSGSTYRGTDISETMIALAAQRLRQFGERAVVALATGDPCFPLDDSSVDRVVSTYVLDLLPEAALSRALLESGRVLRPEGLLCLAGITSGTTPVSRVVMGAWQRLFALNPAWVGGCRPTGLAKYLSAAGWRIRHRNVVVAWGIASEVLVAGPPDVAH